MRRSSKVGAERSLLYFTDRKYDRAIGGSSAGSMGFRERQGGAGMIAPDAGVRRRPAPAPAGRQARSPMPDRTAPRPSPTKRWLRALELTAGIEAQGLTFPDLIDDLATRHGDRPALLSDGECLSFAGLAARSRRYSRWALGLSLPAGATVGLLMPNRPDYLAAWIGVTRVGLSVALLNTNLVGASLAHCIAVGAVADIVVAGACAEAYAGPCPISRCRHGAGGGTAGTSTRCSTACRTTRSRPASAARSGSPTGRSASTRPARRACPRRPTSATAGS